MTSADTASSPSAPYPQGSPGYRRVVGAVFLAGFAVFLVMYDTQGLLPQIGAGFGAGEAATGWSVAATTLGMALGMIPLSTVGLRRGLFHRMLVFLVLSGVIGLACALMPSLWSLVAARFLQGVAVSLVPASALALIGERIAPEAITAATGIYLAGNTVGGLCSRLIPGAVAEFASWRWAMGVMAVLCLACGLGVALLRPRGAAASAGSTSAGARRRPAVGERKTGERAVGRTLRAARESLSIPGVLAACVIGAALMAAFNSAYTVVGFRLQGPELGLGPAAANAVFLLYLLGTFTSARAGRIVGRIGLVPALLASALAVAAGYWIALPSQLLWVVVGLGLMTALFFLGHSSASATVARLAPTSARSTASALYLTAYYVGATAGSALGSVGYEHSGWLAAAGLGTLYAAIAAIAAQLGARAMRRRRAEDAREERRD
ncbi:MFS transporter [Brachybacterium halotolerans subsp. kimchii]|uniref:MFS transporter n=1 Tax=Brachybacterium halotolerans TaxID=2795215 RepID=UPI001E3C81B5|nr:MFS transporter [Brachybacterium halotolerans]UEJ83210.1 MFS transporter [Brachybacterium halotolerans subsp. kimchii]